MQITKSQVSKVESAKKEHVSLLSKELSYSEDLQNKEEIAHIRANIARLDRMIEAAV